MCKNRLMYLTSLAGVLIFHTYYTGWFSWYLLMLTVTLPGSFCRSSSAAFSAWSTA